jgi:tight adherence protein B
MSATLVTVASVLVVILVALAAPALAAGGWLNRIASGGPLGRYWRWWNTARQECGINEHWKHVPWVQLPVTVVALAWATLIARPEPLLVAFFAAVAPLLALHRVRQRRKMRLGEQLHNTLIALANALTTTPNLGEALRSLLQHIDQPMRDELARAITETELGQPLERALTDMAHRLQVPGLETAIAAALIGHRTGGNLPTILRRIAAAIQEMERLHGVIRTKTAEGRNQAWVMGAMPVLLVVALEKIDPEWLALAALFELSAIALIRKITAVDI